MNNKPFGSVLEASAVLNELLRPEGYHRNQIDDLAIWDFLDYEQVSIRAPTKIHLLAAKKALLYATPVIAPPEKYQGIALTSTVTSPAICFDDEHAGAAGLTARDKFRLIGFAFPTRFINHLSTDIFSWKYFYTLPTGYTPARVDISRMDGVSSHNGGGLGPIFLIKPTHYEKVETFNAVNRVIADNLYPVMLPPLMAIGFAWQVRGPPVWVRIERMPPFAPLTYLATLNAVLAREVDDTFACALYESLQRTSSWDLYDDIRLYGFDSAPISEQLRHLAYVKEQMLKVRRNERDAIRTQLVTAREEKIARAYYPYYFDYIDRRALFVRFNTFPLDKCRSPTAARSGHAQQEYVRAGRNAEPPM